MKESDKQKFMQFLSEKNMYDKFALTLWRKKKITFKEYMDNYKGSAEEVIYKAFTWDNAPNGNIPGGNIWQVLDAKWLKYLES